MELGLISDTHGWIPDEALVALAGVDAILHAGDVGGRDVVEMLQHITPVVHVVGGNADPPGSWPASLDVEFEGVRLHMSHGHELDPKGWWLTPEKLAAKYPVDVVVFGHTHRQLTKTVGQTLVINPGAVAANQKRPTVMRLDLPTRHATLMKLWMPRGGKG